jgi:hypothetical protein
MLGGRWCNCPLLYNVLWKRFSMINMIYVKVGWGDLENVGYKHVDLYVSFLIFLRYFSQNWHRQMSVKMKGTKYHESLFRVS